MQFAQLIGGAVSAIGTITGGIQADKIGTYNADQLNRRANANDTATVAKEELLRDRNKETLASQRAALGANGIDATSGSALVGVSQNMRDAELDALTLRYEGLMQSHDIRANADMTLYEGKAKKQASKLGAVGSIVGAAGSYASSGMGGGGSTYYQGRG